MSAVARRRFCLVVRPSVFVATFGGVPVVFPLLYFVVLSSVIPGASSVILEMVVSFFFVVAVCKILSSLVLAVGVWFGLYCLVALVVITSGGLCALVGIFVVVRIGLNRRVLLLSLSSSSCAVNCGAVCADDVIIGIFRNCWYGLALWLLLSLSCAVDCVLFSVIASVFFVVVLYIISSSYTCFC